jgi:hypothetical protein
MVAAVVGLGLAASLLLGVSVQAASAQSMSLAQLVNLFISLGIIPADKAAAAQAAITGSSTSAPASSYVFNNNLTVGSTGADVTALQNVLVSGGYLASGLNTGYFGALTQAAVSKWQVASGITPASGYFGPISRAKINASGSSTTTTTTTTTSTPVTTTTTSTSVNTGVEGILTANLNPTPSSGQNVYEGDSKDALLGIKLQAQLSPITIQRVQLDLGNSTDFYTKVFSTLYLVSDTGTVLAQATLNGNTVVKQSNGSTNTYYLNFSGFNYTVPGDNSVHVLTVEGDLYSSIDFSTLAHTTQTIGIDGQGIRGVDGAGIDQYAPLGSGSNVISNSVLVNEALSNSAQLQISTDSSTPLAQTVVANSGANNNEADGQTVLVFDAYAQKDNIQFQSLSGTTTLNTTGHASPTTAYLYYGSTQIGSAAISWNSTTGTFTFANLNYTIPANTTQALTVKEDIKSADSTAVTQSTVISANGVNAENSQGSTLSSTYLTGSATGNTLTVLQKGPIFSLVGSPTIAVSQTPSQNNSSTSTLNASFTVNIQAIGGNLFFGTQAASSTFNFGVYVGGVESTVQNAVASSTSWSIPSSGVVTSGLPTGNNAFELQQNNSIQIPVTFLYQGRVSASGALISSNTYAIGLDSINWSLNGNSVLNSNFMLGQTGWRTSAVSFP